MSAKQIIFYRLFDEPALFYSQRFELCGRREEAIRKNSSSAVTKVQENIAPKRESLWILSPRIFHITEVLSCVDARLDVAEGVTVSARCAGVQGRVVVNVEYRQPYEYCACEAWSRGVERMYVTMKRVMLPPKEASESSIRRGERPPPTILQLC